MIPRSSTARSIHYYNGAYLNRYGGNDYEFYQLQLPEDNAFSVGERVSVDFVKNEESLPEGGSNYYLFLQFQNGLQEFVMAQNSAYTFPFETRDIPNVNLTGVYFNGTSFITSETGWAGNSVLFDTADKTLALTVTHDKKAYRPGEQVNLAVEARDAQGSPVSAAVNLNLIDEAFYAVMDSTASPLESIYEGLWSGSMFSTNSHRVPVTPYGGAEKGGCFLAGTQILLEDGSTKPIEEIAVGDRVRTLADPRHRTTESGTVAELYRHVISEYLVINGRLRVTPEHLVYATMHFLPAGDLRVGDWMLTRSGEKEFITSIETKRAVVPVYNFRVEPQHTYFADGFYVHNEKGGGQREFFTDAALFTTVATNTQGRASARFTLPDNITSWRVTAQGVSARLEVGVAVSKIPVSLPVFLEATVGKEYVAGDAPVARLRSYGTAFARTDKVQLSLIAPSLGITTAQTQQSTAFTPAFFPLPKLTAGAYEATYGLTSAKGNDAVKLPLTAVTSRLTVQSAHTQDAKDGLVVRAEGNRPMAVVITDRQRSALFSALQQLSWSWGDRIDQGLARTWGTQQLIDTFDAHRMVPPFVAARYQVQSGGLTLLPYSSEDLELSARVAALRLAGFDELSLAQYFFRTLEDASSNREEMTYALYGLAALQQPVLPRLQAWMTREDLSVKERLYTALAAYALGEGETARALFRAIVRDYAQVKEPHIVIKAGETNDEILTNTALAAVLASFLNEPQQYGLRDYLHYHRPAEILLALEDLNFAQASLRTLPQEPQRVELDVEGAPVAADLTTPRFTYSLELQPGTSVTVLKSAPSLAVTTITPVPLAESGLARDPSLGIRREYYVDGAKTTTFHENDLVEVRLIPEIIKNDALDGEYQITDILPSGLLPLTRLFSGGSYDCHYWYPYDREAQKVKYLLNKYWRSTYCGEVYIRYYARVKTKGSYRAEPAVIQSVINPDFMNFTEEGTVMIE
ncbi:hypothetical protein A3J43_01850 [Candidatus Uhrbacteria bacterium RIFCSPHIGHO2_12_FULL_54_23]|uniref:Uncharacterized protein n=2 Tax=Candidatus Uhriibacteriota TaxID=1752732 RepID=A0A1F7UKD8_9BACT|nr:MAG: hypothetical protein A3J43_01850 [Candidatus Uhrbacteria bacterium RIFCSPHIGHO2_12_FULL_54_23]OGL90338.1 MAG: hypothetical protein A3J36_01680 [Candidatus Uhrbacteria bacterium RIFCSPLOWO2_02_FULL_54_37]